MTHVRGLIMHNIILKITELISLATLLVISSPTYATSPPNTLTVTPAGAALGFTLTPIITNIPIFGNIGPSSAIAAKNGDILTIDGNSDLIRVYTNSDKANGSKLKSSHNVVGSIGTQLASLNGTIYGRTNLTPSTGNIIQLNDNGTVAKTIATNIPAGYPLVAAPALNSLLFGSDLGNAGLGQNGFFLITAPNGGTPYNSLNPAPQFYNISNDPIGGTFNMYFDNCSESIYAEAISNLERFALSNATLTHNLELYMEGSPWDGGAYGIGKIGGNSSLYGKFVISNRYDLIILNPNTNERTTILTGGNYEQGRLTPHSDGSLLIPAGNSVFKLRCGNGCSFQ